MINALAANLRKLRLEKQLTQEQAAAQLSVSAQSVSRWETGATLPDVMLLPQIAQLYGVLIDDLFKTSPVGYDNNAKRLLAVYERTGRHEDFVAAAAEFDKLITAGEAAPDDWRSYGVIHVYMSNRCRRKALECYDHAMALSKESDALVYHRTQRQKIQLRCSIGQADDCIAEQQAAISHSPDNEEEWCSLAAAYFMAGQYEQTIHTCQTALARFPGTGLLYGYMGDACRALKRFEEAFAAWEQAVQTDTRFLDSMFSMAFCREELGQYDQAAVQWEEIAHALIRRGLDVEAKWPAEMAEKCRIKMS